MKFHRAKLPRPEIHVQNEALSRYAVGAFCPTIDDLRQHRGRGDVLVERIQNVGNQTVSILAIRQGRGTWVHGLCLPVDADGDVIGACDIAIKT
jgi:hypothetical protein